MINAITYIRVSDPSQIDNTSFDVQRASCKKYSADNKWNIVKEFKEEGESAKASDRTKLKELIEYCRVNKGKIQVCLVYKIDRFARNQVDHYAIKAILLEYGVSVRSATEPVDDTPMGKVIEGLFAAVAQLDNDLKSQRVKEAMKSWVFKGKWVWGAKPGYINQKDETDHALILLDPDKAPAITELFTKFSTSHYTYKNLSDWLNNDKHLRGKRGKKFHPQGIQRILKDKFYMGIISMYEQEIKGVHKPLTDEYTFYKCQEIMLARSNHTTKKRTTESEDFPMRRFIFCPSCNQKLTAAWCKGRGKKYPKYYCVTKGCELRSKSYRREDVHDEFYNLLKKVKPNEDFAGLFKEMFIRVYRNRIQELEGDTIRIKAEIETLESEKVGVIQLAKKLVLTADEAQKELTPIRDRLAVLQLGLRETKTDTEEINICLAYAENFIRTASQIWLDAPSLLKIKLQSMIFPIGLSYPFKDLSNHNLSLPFKLNRDFVDSQSLNVSRLGIEPRTYSLRGSCSNQLSYRPIVYILSIYPLKLYFWYT